MKLYRMTSIVVIAGILATSGCASSPRKRFLIGAGIGGVGGATGGAVFSPNSESRGLNTLVFGLVGTVVGGLLGLLIHDDAEIPDAKIPDNTAVQPSQKVREFSVAPQTPELPDFVKERLKAVVVEELQEPDSVTEDGSLHEPHKVYRIKRQAELIANPIKENRGEK